MQSYLQSGRFVDSDHPVVVEFAEKSRGIRRNRVTRRSRCTTRYATGALQPLRVQPRSADPEGQPRAAGASPIARAKAILLAACARHCRIPARIGLADVRNHLATPRLLEALRSEVFAMHGYTELYLEAAGEGHPGVQPCLVPRLRRRAGVRASPTASSIRSTARASVTWSTWPITASSPTCRRNCSSPTCSTIRTCSPAARWPWTAISRPRPDKMKGVDSHHQPARLPSSVHPR